MADWLNKYIKQDTIPEITVYGKKEYTNALAKQREQYLADMDKYREDSIKWSIDNLLYEKALNNIVNYTKGASRVLKPGDADYYMYRNNYNDTNDIVVKEGNVPFTNSIKTFEEIKKDPYEFEYVTSLLKDIWGDDYNKAIGIYTDNRSDVPYAAFPKPEKTFKRPIKKNVIYDDTYEKLTMHSLWANKAKQDTTAKIGTLSPIESTDPTKGFTINEAMKFPQEVRNMYNIDYIYDQIHNKKQHGDVIRIDDNRVYSPTSGLPLTELNRVGGNYNRNVIDKVFKTAYDKGLDINDAWNINAIAFQESKYKNKDHHLGGVTKQLRVGNEYEDLINAYNSRNELFYNKGRWEDNDTLKLQHYNYDKLLKYNPDKPRMYGIDIPQEGIELMENPLYAKTIINLRDSVLKTNPAIQEIANKYYGYKHPPFENVETNSPDIDFQKGWLDKYINE